jgi:hypothetical protein
MDRIYEHIPKENSQTLYGNSDVDWAMDIRQRCSISGKMFFFAGAMVVWKTYVHYNPLLHGAQHSQNSLPQATFVALVFSSV